MADFILKVQFDAIDRKGRFTLAISGGSLPKMLRFLDGPKSSRVEWDKWVVYFADERVVRLDHPDSNFFLSQNEFFSKVPVPPANIHVIGVDDLIQSKGLKSTDTEAIDDYLDNLDEDTLEELADAYESSLIKEFAQKDSAKYPVFDLILLGMGPDGHTASLFPGHPLLTDQERWVAFIEDSPKPPPKRITFTLPVINHAAKVAFVATGANKQDILSDVLDKPEDGLPSSRVRPKLPGAVYWFVDDPASAKTQYGRSVFSL